MSFFTVHHRSKKSKARVGTIQTSHGAVQTPTFVPCATKGTLKGIPPEMIPDMQVQLMFVNTYHLVTHPGTDIIRDAGGIHSYSKLPTPLMSDSGGFQVFSLGKTTRRQSKLRGDSEEEPLLVKISEDGVKFRSVHDGQLIEFSPETSMQFQREIGADLVMAFDECTYLDATHDYTRKSMIRTHEWLDRCIAVGLSDHQHLYGIIQGGQFEDLRKESAQFISSRDVDGVAIGGVSVGETKEAMREQVRWCSEFLPEEKPVHLLGVGHIDDLKDLISYGIDTFDCVEPTRIARIGQIYQWNGDHTEPIDIHKSIYRNSQEPIDANCDCWSCKSFSKSYLHHLFKQRELLGYTIATFHNVYTIERYVATLREQILRGEI